MRVPNLSRRSVAKIAAAMPLAYAQLSGRHALAESFDDDTGVASGCPTADSIVLWTRVPGPMRRGVSSAIGVQYEVATQEDFSPATIVARGEVSTDESKDYTVKAAVRGLQPFSTYYYRFRTESGYASVVGRTKTAPAPGQAVPQLRLAAVSCQQFSQGYYGAYLALAKDGVDFCVHLGDHIYEKESGSVRSGDSVEARTLEDYRRKYRMYLSDPAWREVRRLYAFIDLWDDHEVMNDYAGARDRSTSPTRFSGAYQAYLEYMPMETELTRGPSGEPLAVWHRKHAFGDLLDLITTDQRQFRTPTPCSRLYFSSGCDAMSAPEHTMLGPSQLRFVKNALENSSARWKLLLSEVMMAPVRISLLERDAADAAIQLWGDQATVEAGGMFVSLDGWDGYPRERSEILGFIQDQAIQNVVFVTGDIHAACNAYLYRDPAQTSGDAAAVEVVTTSISSETLGSRLGSTIGRGAQALITRSNPHYAWNDILQHGYTLLTVNQEAINVEHVAVETVDRLTSNATVARRATIPSGARRFV